MISLPKSAKFGAQIIGRSSLGKKRQSARQQVTFCESSFSAGPIHQFFMAPKAEHRRSMQVSTDLPCGLRAVREHIERRDDTRLPMNVSVEADAAYIAEKKLKVGPIILKSWPIGNCSRCYGVIYDAPFLNNMEPGEFCSKECRDAGRVVKVGRPRLTTKQRKESEAKR